METNCGSFTITLDPEQSPNARRVVLLARATRASTTTRSSTAIVPGFVIQGGDPDAARAPAGPGYTTVDTPPTDASYTHGTVAMAKTGGRGAGHGRQPVLHRRPRRRRLPPDYAIIGTSPTGIDVVDAIGKLGGADEPPTQVVALEKATVTDS